MLLVLAPLPCPVIPVDDGRSECNFEKRKEKLFTPKRKRCFKIKRVGFNIRPCSCASTIVGTRAARLSQSEGEIRAQRKPRHFIGRREPTEVTT